MTLETELLFRDYETVAAPVMASAALLCSIGPMFFIDAGLDQPFLSSTFATSACFSSGLGTPSKKKLSILYCDCVWGHSQCKVW